MLWFFRFVVIQYVSYSIVNAFLNTQYQWRIRQNIDSVCNGLTRENQHISSSICGSGNSHHSGYNSFTRSSSQLYSSPSTSINNQPSQGLYSNSSAFLDFDGINDIIIKNDEKSEKNSDVISTSSLNFSPKKYFLPKDLEDASPEETWNWWEKKKQYEKVLKNAIISKRKDIRPYFDLYSPYLALDRAG